MDVDSSFSVAITGAGGSGAVTTGLILLEAMAAQGYYGQMQRSSGPQIRGGESAVMLHFDNQQNLSNNNVFDYFLAMDWFNVERFIDEIPLNEQSLLIYDKNAGEIPQAIVQNQLQTQAVDFKRVLKEIPAGRANMFGLGMLVDIFNLEYQVLEKAVNKILGKKGEAVVSSSLHTISAGMKHNSSPKRAEIKLQKSTRRWSISGNEACGLGALQAGIRFVAAYPITPATEILEWMAPRLEKLGGGLLQAEDELASINMIIGSSFGGVPSLTATSGPGLSLMLEGIGLAITSETPLVVVNVMRGGPSTGIPTKSEQSDLNIALYGCHGDAPHLVLSCLSIADAVFTTRWAVCLAEQLQTVAIVLSDQSLGQSRAIIEEPQMIELNCQRKLLETQVKDEYFLRYELTDDSVSPMSIPGMEDAMYTADGLEHNSRGAPSSMAGDHDQQLDKRNNKLQHYDYGAHWAEIHGNGSLVIICWGSVYESVKAAIQLLESDGLEIKLIGLRLIMPLQKDKMIQALTRAEKILVVELNHSAQLLHYLQGENILPVSADSFARPGPLPIRPIEIIQQAKRTFI